MVPTFAFGFGMPGPLELFIVALIVLLLFGNRLPGVMRSLGSGIVEFKKGIKGIEDEVENAGEHGSNASAKQEDKPKEPAGS
jgi:sec-independent protein translocase protein TatA